MIRPVPAICTASIALFLALSGETAHADQTYTGPNTPKVWDISTPNWDAGTSTWVDGGNAIFTGTGESVNLNGAITVGNITFNSSGFILADPDNDGTLTLGGPSTITVTNANDTATISDGLASGAIIKAGLGTLVLSGPNSYSGATTVSTGILKVSNNAALGDTTGTTTVTNGAALVLTNGITVTGETLSISGSGGSSFTGALQADAGASATWAGAVTIDSADARVGAQSGGTLTISGVIQNGVGNNLIISTAPNAATAGIVVVSGTSNTYTGTTAIIRGTLKIGATNALPTTTTLDVDTSSAAEDATFDLNGFNQTVAVLQRTNQGGGNGNSFITNSGASTSTLTVNQTSSTTYSGTIQNGTSTVALSKSGGGTLTLSGANTYTGATTISAGTLSLSTGSLTGTAITVSGTGLLDESSTGTIGGNASLTVSAGSGSTYGAILAGANTYTGTTSLTGAGVVRVAHNSGLGSALGGGVSVATGARLELANGITVTGKTLTIAGNGDNNNGALQAGLNSAATWAGNIVIGVTNARLGTQNNATLTVSGIIDDGVNSFGLDISASSSGGVVILSGANTYGGTTGTLNKTGIVRGTLRLGASGVIPDQIVIDVHSAGTTELATFDLNGFSETIAGLRRTDLSGTNASIVTNSSATAATLTLGNSVGTTANDSTFAGLIQNGASSIALVKIGSSIQILTGVANTYTGSTTVNAGTLQVGGVVTLTTVLDTGSKASLASTAYTLNGGTFALNNVGVSNNNLNRINDAAAFTFKGGAFLFSGSAESATNSSETVGDFILSSGISRITNTFGSTNTAVLTANQFTRTANTGLALVNGVSLGKDGTNTASVARILLATTPTLVGTTAALSIGLNVAAKDTQIVPYLLGAVTATTGGLGTASTTANTFVTYEASTGLRPLNLTDEFTQNAFTAGNNIRLTSATNAGTSVSINSLILEGASATITSGQTLTVASGAILFSSGSAIGLTNGTLAFGNREGLITINSTGNTSLGAVITGTAGVSYYGSGTLVLNTQQNTYSGSTLLQVAGVIPQSSSIGLAGTPTSGPFGTGTVILGGSALRSQTGAETTIANPISFAADTTILTSSVFANDKKLIFTGPVTLSGGSRLLTQNSGADTLFSGNIGDGGNALGLTLAGTGPGVVNLGGTNSYTGATTIKAGTLVVSGSLSGSSAVTVGDAANLATSATLGGGGTVGNVTVGAALGNTGAVLKPHAGSASTSTGSTLTTGSVTFANSSAHLALQIGRTTGGDVSDHLQTTGPVTLNGADFQLSLLTTSHAVTDGDVFFLIINGSGSPIGGTFASLNGVATDLSEGATFNLGAQYYTITYLASFSANAFTGGNDAALLAVVPEPGALVSLLGGLGGLLGWPRRRRGTSRKDTTSA